MNLGVVVINQTEMTATFHGHKGKTQKLNLLNPEEAAMYAVLLPRFRIVTYDDYRQKWLEAMRNGELLSDADFDRLSNAEMAA